MDPLLRGPSVSLERPPPAISGGTLLVLERGVTAVAADPDRDRIVIVDLVAGRPIRTIELAPGSEPGRVVENESNGRVHVVLRGSDQIVSFDPESADEPVFTETCAMPRGLAYDAATDSLDVACRAGEIIKLSASTGERIHSAILEDSDLRDIVYSNGQRFVTRFRAAELLRINDDAELMQRLSPATLQNFAGKTFAPAVAWRAVHTSQGVAVVHQRASGTPVEPAPGGYGGGGECQSSIVQSSVTLFGTDGSVRGNADLSGVTLPVDMAVSVDESRVAIVGAANQSGVNSVQIFDLQSLTQPSVDGFALCVGGSAIPGEVTNPIAAAYTQGFGSAEILIVQQREPSQLSIWDGARLTTISLGGDSRFDTGHSVFHTNSGSFIACASCHAEGGDDGRTWDFNGIGPRRTPQMTGNLRGTEPFHWDGDMDTLDKLVHDVFTDRMGGPDLPGHQVDALGAWLDDVRPPIAAIVRDAAAVERGRALFQGEAQCTTCHADSLFTTSGRVDVGTGGRFEIPSLVGVSLRLPVMHHGCATTLRQRFEPGCGGGDAHGRTEHLGETQIDDLVAYLATL